MDGVVDKRRSRKPFKIKYLVTKLAQKTVVHKGYHGTIEVNTKDYSLYGKILFIDEEFEYSGKDFTELDKNFQTAVEKHIKLCKKNGQKPPFSE
jgi:predicted HicB family RNase H-like nuclease